MQQVASVVNDNTDGILFTGGMIVFFVILVMQFMNRSDMPIENNISVSAWIMFIISGFFWYAHLIYTIVPLSFLGIAAISTLFMYSSK